MGSWIAQRPLAEVVDAFEKAEAAVAPIYDISDVFKDPQYQALDTITTVEDPDLGPLRMQNVLYRLSDTPGSIRWTGRKLGADTREVLQDWAQCSDDEIAALESDQVIYLGEAT